MSLFGFLKRGRRDEAARDWLQDWERAVEAGDAEASARLRAALAVRAAAGDEVELEEEMLQALDDLRALERNLAAGELPTIETSHRVAAGERCHFSAPVAMPDDPAQPTGRLLLTSGRAAFAGAARAPAVPWHATRSVIRAGRDIVFVRAGSDDGIRFRCNSFSDAVCATAIARHLLGRVRKPV